MNYVSVIVLTNTGKTDQLYTYQLDHVNESFIGRRVEVDFGIGKRKYIGIIVQIHDQMPDFPVKKVKRVLDEEPLINQELLFIAKHMAETTLANYTQSLRAVIPPGLETSLEQEKKIKLQTHRYYQLNVDEALEKIPLRAKRQRAIISFMLDGTWHAEKELLKDGGTKSVLDILVEKEFIIRKERRVYRNILPIIKEYEKKDLNEEQKQVYNSIIQAKSGTFLIKGVTGSGKTEIYLHLVERAFQEGKDSIVLVPEIALTPQTIERFSGRFGEQVAVLHSRLSLSERFDQWIRILKGKVKIVVGARSAIFAPFNHLGMIIIDEEHEDSYQGDRSPKYDARDIGRWRANYHHIPIVLGSATPRIESFYAAKKGNINLLELKNRATKQKMPELKLVDMRKELKEKNNSMFSRLLYYEMKLALRKNEQIILFLNKRGFSSFVFCRECGYVEKCDSCDVSMTYHHHQNRLICHYCGKTKKIPQVCPVCGSKSIKYFGAGTEQVERYTKKLFPHANIARMDMDTTRKKNDYENIYQRMKKGKIDILIGTQMIAKGLDFEKVSLVGILAADISLNLPNYKASEKAFQLITQVAGRAGRGNLQGKAIVQTYQPNHFAIQASKNYDYHLFYEEEIRNRMTFQYPPFWDIAAIVCQGKNRKKTEALIHAIYSSLKLKVKDEKLEDIIIIGPNLSRIAKIKDKFRFQILLKSFNHLEEMKKIGKRVCIDNEDKIDFGEVDINLTINPTVIL